MADARTPEAHVSKLTLSQKRERAKIKKKTKQTMPNSSDFFLNVPLLRVMYAFAFKKCRHHEVEPVFTASLGAGSKKLA